MSFRADQNSYMTDSEIQEFRKQRDREYARKWREAHPNYMKDKNRLWRLANPIKCQEQAEQKRLKKARMKQHAND